MAMAIHPVTLRTWDRRFFEMCALLGSWSEDRSRQVGCVIVGNANDVRALGFNGLPRGVNGGVDERHRRENGEKYYWFEHAERNAIYNAARVGTPIAGCRLYANLFPCAECVRAIIQSGIVSVHTYNPPQIDVTFSRSFEVATAMLEESGVELYVYDSIMSKYEL